MIVYVKPTAYDPFNTWPSCVLILKSTQGVLTKLANLVSSQSNEFTLVHILQSFITVHDSFHFTPGQRKSIFVPSV